MFTVAEGFLIGTVVATYQTDEVLERLQLTVLLNHIFIYLEGQK